MTAFVASVRYCAVCKKQTVHTILRGEGCTAYACKKCKDLLDLVQPKES